MRFDLTDLRLFLNVHEAGTITGGAQATHMTLASASERIRGMEQDLGAPLLLRGRHGVTATPAGRTLLAHARQVLRQMDRLYGELAGYGGGLQAHARVLCNTSAASHHLPEMLAGFLARHPGVSIDLQERPSQEIAEAVRSGGCDIGIVADSVDLAGLEQAFFRRDPLCLVVSRTHPLARFDSLALAEAADQPFVGLGAASALQQHLGMHARQLGKRLSYRIRLQDLESVCRVVGQGIGVAVVPLAVARRHGRAAGLKRLSLTDAWAARSLVVCLRSRQALAPHVTALLDHMLAARVADLS